MGFAKDHSIFPLFIKKITSEILLCASAVLGNMRDNYMYRVSLPQGLYSLVRDSVFFTLQHLPASSCPSYSFRVFKAIFFFLTGAENSAFEHWCWTESWKQSFEYIEKNIFIALPGRGGHRRIMPLKTMSQPWRIWWSV